MDNDLSKAENEFEKVSELVKRFGSQSKQIQSLEDVLQNMQKVFEKKAEEVIVSANQQLRDAKTWYEQTTDDIGALCSDLTDSFEPFQNVFDEVKIKDLCAKLSELVRVLEECKSLKEDIDNMRTGINAIRDDFFSVKKQQEEDRAYLELMFSEILAKLEKVDSV